MNLEIYLKINVSCEASINFHHVSQNITPRFAKNTQHDTSAAPATKNASSENDAKILRLPHQKTIFDTLWNMLECQSTTPATWNEATRRLKPPKVTTFAEFAIGTAIATSLSMVADDCRRLRSQKRRRASTSPPQTPKVKRELFITLRYAFGKQLWLVMVIFHSSQKK